LAFNQLISKFDMIDPRFDFQFRVILTGDSMVGKSSLVRYFSEGKFSTMCDPTVGVDFFARLVTLSNNVTVKLQLWDTAGQEKFRSITKTYYRSSVAAVLVFDMTNRRSFEHLSEWYEEARSCMRCTDPTFLLVGHKVDLSGQRQVSNREAQHFAQTLGAITYLETSALTGQNVENAFIQLAEAVYQKLCCGSFDTLRAQGWDGIKEGYGCQMLRSNSMLHSQEWENERKGCCQ
jgi:Ras-related protein Rab-39B